jgi:hypothetical protein
MNAIPMVLFALLVVANAALVLSTGHLLPEQLATHFDFSGRPDGWMSRGGYQAFMIAFAVVLPTIEVALLSALPRLAPSSIRLPHREQWLAPERREETLGFLSRHGYWLGCLLSAFLGGVHLAIVAANQQQPAHMPRYALAWVLVPFVLAIALWIGALLVRFHKAPPPASSARAR